MSSIPRLYKEKVPYLDEGSPFAAKWAVWGPERKNETCIQDLVRNFSRPENLVMNFCAAICSVAKGCMLLDQNGTLVGCEVDSDLLTAAEADFVLETASQVLNPKYDISGKGDVKPAAKL